MKLYYAKVTDLNDSDQKGRVQVRLLPEMESFKVGDLPWVLPFSNLGQNTYSFTPPVKDSYVWVVFQDDYYKNGYILSEVFIKGLFDYDAIKSDIGSITDVGSQTYPELQFRKLQDGSIEFYNTSTTERGILHPSGSWFIFDSSGNIILDAGGTSIKLNSSGAIDIDSGTNNINVATGTMDVGGTGSEEVLKVSTFKSTIATILTLMDTHTHPDVLTGMSGPSPMTATFSSVFNSALDLAKAGKLKTL